MMTYECLLGKIPFRVYSELDLGKIVTSFFIVGFGLDYVPVVCRCER